MAKLLLIKHSLPEIVPETPSRAWLLSAEGRERCVWLGGQLKRHGVERLYASLEPKATETAFIAGAEAGLIAMAREGLHENDRTGLPFLPREELEQRIRDFFAKPDELVMGNETARAAWTRFERAVRERIVSGLNTAIVAHGTVITALVSAHNDVEPFELWAALGLPGYVVLDAETFDWDGAVINRPAGSAT